MAAAWESAPLVGDAEAKTKRAAWEDAPIIEDKSDDGLTSYQKAAHEEAKRDVDALMMTVPNAVAGAMRGAGSIGATLLWPIDKATDIIKGDRGQNVTGLVTGKQPLSRNEERRLAIDAGLRELGADPDSTAYKVGKVGAEIAGTAGAGGLLANLLRSGAPAVAASAPRLVSAIESGGMRAGNIPANAGIVEKGGNMLARIAGGTITGGTAAGLVDPEYAVAGAVTGGALPPALSLLSKAGKAAGGLVRPFYKGGQERIVGNTLREFATDPDAALINLRNSREMIPGSQPTAVMSAGDEGLAGLSRTLQSQSGQYAGELSARQAAQNAARTKAIEDVAGNTGKISLAEKARDEATAAMRESVLDSAGKLPAEPVISSIDRLIKKPDNAGKLAQQALNEFRGRIAQFAPDGQIDARALYAIRKDINDVLGGKLQGEAGNMRYASGQLIKVKELIDDAIDKASRVVPPVEGRALMPYGSNVTVNAGPYGSMSPRPTWSQYLQEYSKLSKPIEQMKELDDVLRRIQTGTVDQSGNAVLSAAKLNNLLKNEGKDLSKKLTDEQLDLLRRLSADLNASQLASNAGRAVGSNTVQNLAQGNLLKDVLGKSIGGGTVASSTLGRLMQLPYGAANQQIVERLGSSLLDPQEAARLLQTPEGNKLLRALSGNAQIGYRAAPVLSAQ